MAPSGYKTFSAGAILTATADVQNYLMDQVVSVHDDASARSSAISSPAEGQVSYLKDTNKVYLYNGSAWVEVGGGIAWSGSTANGLGTYSSASEIVAESSATYDGTTLQLTTSGGGLKLDGLASTNANTLDDYEEGTFTMTYNVQSGTVTINTSFDTGQYTKIGRLVFISGRTKVSSISSPSGWFGIAGLPFAVSASITEGAEYSDISCRVEVAAGTTDATLGTVLYCSPTATEMGLLPQMNTSATNSQGQNIGAATVIEFGGCYITDS